MKQVLDGYIFDADDEDPDCMRCMHCTEYSDEYCCDFCGAHNGWAEYERKEYINSSDYSQLKDNNLLCKYCMLSLTCDKQCDKEDIKSYIDFEKAYLMGDI